MARTKPSPPDPVSVRPRRSSTRLDVALVERSLAPSRERAQALIMAGVVRVNGETERRASRTIPKDQEITVDAPPRYVSRGGYKLEQALEHFRLDPTGLVCLDAGASTGGFVDCLLQSGAVRVYAADVGYGQLDYRLREDPRVVVMERINVRYLESLPERVQLATADVSFISLRLILPALRALATEEAPLVTLIKPQFEAGRGQVGRGGVVREAETHVRILNELRGWGEEHGEHLARITYSPLRGPAGNTEFLGLWTCVMGVAVSAEQIQSVVAEAHASVQS